MTINTHCRPNLSRAQLQRRAARTSFLLTVYAAAQLHVLAELVRLYLSY